MSVRQQQGIIARMAMHDVALQTAFDALEGEIKNEWASCWTTRGRERCHYELQAVQRLRRKLASSAANAPRD